MNMKVEFIKETSVKGDVVYYTEVNETLVLESQSEDEKTAKEFYRKLLAGKGHEVKEILETKIVTK